MCWDLGFGLWVMGNTTLSFDFDDLEVIPTPTHKRRRSRPWLLSLRRTLISEGSWQKSGVSTVAKEKGKAAGGEGTLKEDLPHHLQNKGLGIKNRDSYCLISEETEGVRQVAHLCSPAPQSYAQRGVGTKINELSREPERVSRISHRKEG